MSVLNAWRVLSDVLDVQGCMMCVMMGKLFHHTLRYVLIKEHSLRQKFSQLSSAASFFALIIHVESLVSLSRAFRADSTCCVCSLQACCCVSRWARE